MSKEKKIRYLFDGQRDGCYVRAWNEDRQTIAVQVWRRANPVGTPDGDWAMPKQLGIGTCIAQAILQTPKATMREKQGVKDAKG